MNSLIRVAVRQLSTTVTKKSGEVPQGYKMMKEKQKMFNLDNGLRVHERGGMVDSVLINSTMLLMVIGGVFWVQTVYTLAFPKKE